MSSQVFDTAGDSKPDQFSRKFFLRDLEAKKIDPKIKTSSSPKQPNHGPHELKLETLICYTSKLSDDEGLSHSYGSNCHLSLRVLRGFSKSFFTAS